MEKLGEENFPRIQVHAMAAIFNFVEQSEEGLLVPYLDKLLQMLMTLLQKGPRIVQEQTVTTIACLAGAAKEVFLNYYDKVVPVLKQIIAFATKKEDAMLRSKYDHIL
jgi:hypothetical protein